MATVEDVELLVEAVQGRALVKASGKIVSRDQVLAMLQAGAAVVGTSKAPEICSDEE
jgi:deoxyribose-phosphate aldolase